MSSTIHILELEVRWIRQLDINVHLTRVPSNIGATRQPSSICTSQGLGFIFERGFVFIWLLLSCLAAVLAWFLDGVEVGKLLSCRSNSFLFGFVIWCISQVYRIAVPFSCFYLVHYLHLIPSILQLIAGLSKPTSGSIYIQRYGNDGKALQSSEELTPEKVGIVFQFPER